MFLVKICGITRSDNWTTCVEAGADLVGFVFYPPSKRAVSPAAAATLAVECGWSDPVRDDAGAIDLWKSRERNNGEPGRVGVFVNPTRAEVEAAIDAGKLSAIQLHGDSLVEGMAAAQDRNLPVLMGLPVKGPLTDADFVIPGAVAGAPAITAFLCDNHRKGEYGGTGEQFDHDAIRPWLDSKKLILAGGLDPKNVREAVAALPGIVGADVSTGVESAPGVKDPEKIRKFIAEARAGALANPETVALVHILRMRNEDIENGRYLPASEAIDMLKKKYKK